MLFTFNLKTVNDKFIVKSVIGSFNLIKTNRNFKQYHSSIYVFKGPFSQPSNFYSVPTVKVENKCRVQLFDLNNNLKFSRFIEVFHTQYRLRDLDSNSAATLFLFYTYFPVLITTNFFEFLVASNKNFLMPNFVAALIYKFAPALTTGTFGSGYATGSIDLVGHEEFLRSLLKQIKSESATPSPITEAVMSTNLSAKLRRSAFENHLYKIVDILYSQVTSSSSSYESERFIYEFVVQNLSNIMGCLYYPELDGSPICKPILFRPLSYKTGHLGIYRFRNYKLPGTYIVGYSTCSSVGTNTFDLLAIFLHIFTPQFLNKDWQPLSTEVHSGEVLLDVSNSPTESAIESIFCLEITPTDLDESPEPSSVDQKDRPYSRPYSKRVLSPRGNIKPLVDEDTISDSRKQQKRTYSTVKLAAISAGVNHSMPVNIKVNTSRLRLESFGYQISIVESTY